MSNKPYVFISYAHFNSDVVLPCVQAMKDAGINIWYDEGIEAGSEWPEYIAQKVVSCSKFVLFVSEAFLNSQNCKRELNFAISRKKDILTIFIEDVSLSPGMEMQLGTCQAIYLKRFESAAHFHKSLAGAHFFDMCRLSSYKSETEFQTNASTQNDQSFRPQSNDNRTNSSSTFGQTYTPPQQQSQQQPRQQCAPSIKNRYVAAVLTFFFGCLGGHKFYLKQYIQGVLYLVFYWTYVPFILSCVEFFLLLFAPKEKLEKWYTCQFKK